MFGMGMAEMLIFVIAALVVPVSVFYLGLRWVRTAERRAASQTESADLRERVAHLEEALSDVTSQIERLARSQEFTSRFLEERPKTAGSPAAK